MTDDELMNKISPDIGTQRGNPSYIELGTTGLSVWGNDVYEEFLPNLRWPYAEKIFREMSSNDPVVCAILLCAKELIRKVTWKVTPASKSTKDQEASEFLESCRNDMSITWADLIDEIMSYFIYGWSYHEIIYKKRTGLNGDSKKNSKYNDSRIGWRKISGRSQASWAGWVFDEDDDGSLTGMYQQTTKDKIFIPIEKAILNRTTADRGNPEGRSFLRGAYRPWYFKKHIEEIEGIGIERDLAGLPVLTAPEGVDLWDEHNPKAIQTRAQGERLVRSIRRDKNEGVFLPNGYTLELLSAKSARQFDTNAIINRYDQRIAITLLSDIVMLGADKVGSFALADVKKSLLATSLDAQVQSVVSVFNRYAVPRLFNYNLFPGITDYPKIEAGPVEAPDLKELGDYIQKLSGARMPLFPNVDLENHLRSVANLPLTDENDPARIAMEEDRKARNSNKNSGDDNNNNNNNNNNKGNKSAKGGE